MLLILLISLFFIFLITGFGLFVKRLVPGLFFTTSNMFDPFWLGFAVLIALLQLWHFVLPVNTAALWLIFILSLFGWFNYRKLILSRVSLKFVFLLAGLMLILFVLINHVLFSEASYDHGLYHLQTVKWFNTYPIVPGLGNLQHRLAFNSSNYLYVAFLNTSIFQGYSYYVSAVIMAAMLILQSLVSLSVWITDPQSASKRRLFAVLLLPVIIFHVSSQPLAGYPADLTIFIFQLVIFEKLLFLMEEGTDFSVFWQILVLTAAASTIKLSFVPFGVLVMVVAWIVVFGRFKNSTTLKKLTFSSVAAILVWGLPWLARNLILSGYLLYPSRLIKIPFQWKMPSFLVNDLQAGISLWARTNSGHLNYTADLNWFLQWLKRFNFEPRGIIFLTILLSVVFVLLLQRKNSRRINFKPYLFLFPLTTVSMLVWFLSAPAYRFSGAIIWLLFMVVFLMIYDWVLINISAKSASNLVLIMVLFLFFFLQNNFSKNFSFSNLLMVENEMNIAQHQQPEMVVKTTKSGLVVNLPVEGELCWNLPLPCTTPNDFLPELSLIDSSDLGKGFYIDEAGH